MAIANHLPDRYSAGRVLQDWRKRRRLSQLNLALRAEVSPRHVSFLETGRSHPSRDMLLHLAKHLQIPPREQNALLMTAGFAPAFTETPLTDASFEDAHRVIELTLRSHEPYPAMAIDRHWNIVLFNRALEPMLSALDPQLREPAINVLRLTLHPRGIAPQIMNLGEWREHLLIRLRQQIDATSDPALIKLLREVSTYPHDEPVSATHPNQLAVPLVLQTPFGLLRFYRGVP